MTINTNLLVSAAMLQDYIVRKDDGFPLANGIVTLYKDNARSFYKNWYYQTGSPGAYSWVALDNPLTLSSVGTIQDPNGNDVIPFYYPYEEDDENVPEAYYITVYDSDESGNPTVLQFTRENFPFQPSGVSPTSQDPTFRNYILNNIYWRNIGALDAMTVLDQVIAPSQHDGYTNGDIRFIKNVSGANDDIAFLPMTEVLDNDITPEYYLNMKCTALQAGETVKCIQYPISLHVKTLQNVMATVVFQGQNVAGNVNNYVDLQIYQYLGTGALTQPDPVLIQRVTLNNDFQKFVISFIFPDAAGLTLGNGGDDALFLRVQYPLAATFEINHTKPQLYLSTDVPDNDFDTYDQVETIINSPRTGDFRTSLNQFNPFGWVSLNDGTLGNSSSNATGRANIDAWPLYNLIWGLFHTYDHAGINLIAQMYTSAGATVAYGGSAIADWNANKAVALTKTMGKVILGTVPITSLLQPTYYEAFTTAANVCTVISNVNFFNGMPVVLQQSALPAPLAEGVVYYITAFNGTTQFSLATTFANALAGTVIAFGVGSGTAVFAPAGTVDGENAHTLTIAEMPAHTHTTFPNFGVTNAAAGGGVNAATAALGTPTGSTGGGAPHNNLQPGTFMNMYMKL